jgi:hypothetical protein
MRYQMFNIRTQIRTDLNPSKRIRSRIRPENIRTIFIPTKHHMQRTPKKFSIITLKNRCWIVSKLLQKQYLSLVSITSFLRNQRKILILIGNLKRQISCVTLMSLVMRYLYIDLTVKLSLLLKVHVAVSFPTCRFTFAIVAIRLFHSNNLFPISDLLKETLRGVVLNTLATVACFLWTMLYKFGNI